MSNPFSTTDQAYTVLSGSEAHMFSIVSLLFSNSGLHQRQRLLVDSKILYSAVINHSAQRSGLSPRHCTSASPRTFFLLLSLLPLSVLFHFFDLSSCWPPPSTPPTELPIPETVPPTASPADDAPSLADSVQPFCCFSASGAACSYLLNPSLLAASPMGLRIPPLENCPPTPSATPSWTDFMFLSPVTSVLRVSASC